MPGEKPKRKNSDIRLPDRRKSKPPSTTRLYVIVGGVVIFLLLLILGGWLLTTNRTPEKPVLPTLFVLNPTATPTAVSHATLPPTWTPTPIPPTDTPSPTRPTSTPRPPTTSDTSDATPLPPAPAASDVTGRQVIVNVDQLPLQVWPGGSDSTIIEYAVRGAVRTILDEGQAYADDGTPEIWWYVGDGYGWIPSQLNGQPTTVDYTPDALDQMLVDIDQRQREDRGNFLLALYKGWMLYSKKDYGSAISMISVSIETSKELGKEDASLYQYRGKVYLDMKDYPNALRNFDQAIALGVQEPMVYVRRGLANQYLGHYDEARQDFSTAVQIAPDYGLPYNNLGALIGYQNKYDSAQLKYYDQSIEVDPLLPFAFANRANYYRLSGDTGDHVINDYTTALSFMPNELSWLLNRGVVYSMREDFTLARADYTRIIAYDPTYTQAYIDRGIDYHKTGNDWLAIQDLLQALKFDSTSQNAALAYYTIGNILFQNEQFDGALYAYNRALDVNPDYYDAQINRSQIYEMFGGIDEATLMSYPSLELVITPFP